MTTRVTLPFGLLAAAVLLIQPVLPAQALQGAQYRYAYYLYIAPPADVCKACYVPLLLTFQSLEELTTKSQGETAVLITTYERDSIWAVDRAVPVSPSEIKPQERHIRLQGHLYRYQQVGADEVLRLLENPEGTIPIHRVFGTPTRASLRDLVQAFRPLR